MCCAGMVANDSALKFDDYEIDFRFVSEYSFGANNCRSLFFAPLLQYVPG